MRAPYRLLIDNWVADRVADPRFPAAGPRVLVGVRLGCLLRPAGGYFYTRG